MKITEIIKRKKTFSLEFFPPKTEKGFLNLVSTIKELSNFKPDFISVTDSGYGLTKGKSIALSQIIREKTQVEIMPHLTCINNTAQEIEAILEKIEEWKIENVLALRGDRANYPNFNSQFNYAIDLIRKIRKNKNLCIGVAGYPEKHPEAKNIVEDISHLKEKLDAGGDFIITQLFFDNKVFFNYIDLLLKKGIKSPVIPGIMPVHSKKNLEEILKKAGNISIPSKLKEIVEKAKEDDFLYYSSEFTIRQCEDLFRNGINAIHFFTFNKSGILKNILRGILGEKK